MIKLITIDCWDTILENNAVWDSVFIEHAHRIFVRLNSSWSKDATTTAFRKEALQFSQTLAHEMITIPILDRLRNLSKTARINLSQPVLEELRKSFESAIFCPLPRLVSGSEEFLTRVKSAHKKLGLVCNTGWFSSNAIASVLQRYQLDRLIDFAVYSDQVGHAKPSSKIFEAGMEIAGCSARETVHIGDNLFMDVMGALNTGQHAIHLHRNGRCTENGFRCASTYQEIWNMLTVGLGL